MKKISTDHLGNVYPSLGEMCSYYHIPPERYTMRIHLGWSIKDALTKVGRQNRKCCSDHLGNEYESEASMCQYYDIEPSLFQFRMSNNWGLEKALTTPSRKYASKQHTMAANS